MVNEIIDLKVRGKLTLQIVNGYQIVIESYMVKSIDKTTTTNGAIKSVSFNSEITYKIGDTLSMSVIKKTPYTFIIQEIFQLTPTTFLFTTDTRNKSTYYLAPTIFTHKSKIGWTTYNEGRFAGFDNCNFINAYIEFSESKLENLVVKYLFTTNESYLSLEKDLEKTPYFIERIDVGQYVYFKFQIPHKYLPDIDTFLEGKYSKLGIDLKKNILNFMTNGKDAYYQDLTNIKINNLTPLKTPLAQGLFLHPELNKKVSEQLDFDIPLDWELMSKPDLSKEFIIL